MRNSFIKSISLVSLLLTLGVGNVWAGTKRIYVEYSAVSGWWGNDGRTAIPYIYAWGGGHDAKKYTMTATGTSNLAYCDIDDYHESLLFFRSTSQTGSWDNQTVDVTIGSNNRWSILNTDTDSKKNIGSAQRWTPSVAIDGLLDPKNPHNQAFVDGEFTATLEARKTYEFKIIDGTTLYGLNDNVWTSSVSEYTLKSGEYQIRLCTAGAGTYTFTWDGTNKKLSVDYPDVSHPNMDYCYIINYNWSPSTNFYPWNCSSTKVGEWNDKSTIQGVIVPGTSLYNTTTIYGQSYFYIAAGEYANFVVTKNNDSYDRTGDVATADGYGKRRYYNNTTWVWDTIQVHIALNDLSATTHVSPNHMDVAFLSEVLTDLTSVPTKTHYDFGGFYTGYDEVNDVTTGTQVIDEDGHWIASVADYTDASKHWIHAGTSTTLYAKWTEHEYAITIAVTGSGSTSPASSTTAKYVTASGDISAIPASGYSFRDWDFSKTGVDNDVYSADGYSSTSNPIHILAQHDGTLTANFTANGYTVTLEDLGADEGHKGTSSVSVTYDATTNLTTSIMCPQKSHYDFGGYWTSSNGGSTLTTQLIDANGAWIAGVSGYTSATKQWICAGDTTLYAKWTETAYTITPSVSPAGAGSVNTVTDAHLVTPSSTITATPANAAWIFDYWEYGEHVGYASGSGNAITVRASQNSTITAHFKPRYELRGDIYDGSGNGGMPGWETGDAFTFNSFTALGTGEGKGCDLSCSRTLTANTTYRFQIHDRVTGNHGYATVATYIGDGDHLLFNTKDQNVMLAAIGAGTYTFRITNITEDNGKYYPTVSVERPHEVNFGQKYLDIDGTLHAGTTGGTAAATAGSALSSGDYVTYNTSVTHTATPESGYTFAGWWSSDAFEGARFSDNNPMTYAVTSGDNTYAKFVETSTSVTLANDGNGKVQIGGEDATSTTCGVTTTRELTAVPNAGYKFKNWTTSATPDFEVSNSTTATTTLTGHGAGTAGTLTANFEERYSIKGTMNGENWGTTHTLTNIGTNAGSKDTCYVTMTLPANTTYEFAIYDEQTGGWLKNSTTEVFNMTYTNHTDWGFGTDKTVNCGITTAGKGTYKFIFNITDKTVTVVYPTSYQVNYGASPSVGGSITVVDDDSQAVPNGGYVRSGGSVTYTAAAASGYTFVGWCNNDSYGNTFTNLNPWTNSSIAATSNAYAKFKSTNFVIYRSGDRSSDPRAAYDDVESYNGGTISETIEFRMKVHQLDYWYTLCLPFEVNAVKVYEDGEYYDLVPFYRTGGKYYTGHYIIRTPENTTEFPIANFDQWNDPASSSVLPSANTPYIIQWHDSYFSGKYISFFGSTGQTIPSFSAGSTPSSNDVVNVYGNNSMTSGSVTGAYLLEADYGPSGAWLRAEDPSASRTILPFECYILANSTTTTKYRAIRRGMSIDNTPTGFLPVTDNSSSVTRKVLINNQIYIIREGMIYTIQGSLVKEAE